MKPRKDDPELVFGQNKTWWVREEWVKSLTIFGREWRSQVWFVFLELLLFLLLLLRFSYLDSYLNFRETRPWSTESGQGILFSSPFVLCLQEEKGAVILPLILWETIMSQHKAHCIRQTCCRESVACDDLYLHGRKKSRDILGWYVCTQEDNLILVVSLLSTYSPSLSWCSLSALLWVWGGDGGVFSLKVQWLERLPFFGVPVLESLSAIIILSQ